MARLIIGTDKARTIPVLEKGTPAVINALPITPSTSSQTFTPPTGVDGYAPVSVSAVDSTIDANITAGNIKDGVTILGVAGTYTGTTPTGTINITTEGLHNVTNYATANVNIIPDEYIYKDTTTSDMIQSGTSVTLPIPEKHIAIIDFGNVSDYGLSNAYGGSTGTLPTGVNTINLDNLIF